MISTARQTFFVVLCFAFLNHAYCQAPAKQDSTLQAIDTLFTNGSYLSSELEARRLLEMPGISDSIKAQAEKYVAFSLVAQGKNDEATEHFISAMKYDSAFSLDPVLTSPKIMSVYRDAREQFRLRQLERPPKKEESLHEIQNGPSFRALLFPGWEQIHQGKNVKGYALLGAGAVSLASTLYFDQVRKDKRSTYLAASTPAEASARYTDYNSAYKDENYSVALFGIVYLYSMLDAFVSLPPRFNFSVSPLSSSLSFTYSW